MQIIGIGHIKRKTVIKKDYDLKIAIFRRGGLGDGLIESALLGSIKNHFNNSYISAYSDMSFLQILHKNINCNNIVPVEWRRGLMTEIDVRNHYIDLHDLWFDVKPLQFLEGKRSNEFISPDIRNKLSDIESRYYFFNGRELVEFYEEMGVRGQVNMFQKIFNISSSMSNAFLIDEETNIKLPNNYVTISAGWTDTSYYKSWDKNNWEEICSLLNKNGICPVQIGKSNEDIINGAINVTHLSLEQQYNVIKNSLFHLGTDGFFAHVASKYEKPAIILWGVTPWQVWGQDKQYDVISPKFDCLWWSNFNWAHDSRCHDIMNAISVDMVNEKIQLLMEDLEC